MPPDPRWPPDAETLPGIHGMQDILHLQRENDRLRRERDEARAASSSVLPPAPGRLRMLTKGGEYTVVLAVAYLARAAARKWWPEGAELIDGLLGGVGL